MSVRLDSLRDRFTKTRSAIETLEAAAVERGEDATTDAQRAEIDALYVTLDEITPLMEAEADRAEKLAKGADIVSRMNPVPTGLAHTNPRWAEEPLTPGEYAYEFIRAHNRYTDAAGQFHREEPDRLERLLVRSGMIDRAGTLQHQATTDNAGLIPTYIVGDVIKFVDASRPVISTSRRLPMPAKGKTFTRPRATQFTQNASQDVEGDVLASRKFLVTGDTVTKGTYGGVLNISEQDIDDTEPALLDLAIGDMADQYAIETEDVAATAVENAVTSNVTSLSLSAPSDEFIAAVASAVGSAYGTSRALPDLLYASVDRWAYLVGLTDDDGRPLFPNLAPVNAPGTSDATSFASRVMGLQLVVSPEFSNGFFAVAVSKYVESYENLKGLATLQAPSVLETQIAYRGRFAINVYAQAIQGLAP